MLAALIGLDAVRRMPTLIAIAALPRLARPTGRAQRRAAKTLQATGWRSLQAIAAALNCVHAEPGLRSGPARRMPDTGPTLTRTWSTEKPMSQAIGTNNIADTV
jgi:hypothetical protein